MDAFSLSRHEFFSKHVSKFEKGIEIGPSYRPTFPKKDDWNIFIVDTMDKQDLIKKYQEDPNITKSMIESIEDVDLVWDGSSDLKASMSNEVEFVIACHVIEHQVCLIAFLNMAERLTSNGGLLFLTIPHNELMFDYYRNKGTISDVLTAYFFTEAHNFRMRLDEILLTALLENRNSWDSEFSKMNTLNNKRPQKINTEKQLTELLKNIINSPSEVSYVDRHRWVFSPESFNTLIQQLFDLGLSNWKVSSIAPGIDCEFMVVLEKSNSDK